MHMKKVYEEPEMKIVTFSFENVISTSNPTWDPAQAEDDELIWIPRN